MGDEISCTEQDIQDFANYGYDSKCAFVLDNCTDFSTVDFFKFYYCTLNENNLYFAPFSIIFIFIMFYGISATAENYLEPVLSRISKILRFSESLSGVTLVALANGAPDVISAWAAGGSSDGGVLVPLGALFGAGMFTACFILCVCILISPGRSVQTDKDALTRDCFFYFLACLYFLVFGFIGKIWIGTTVGVFLMYCVFIGVAVYYEVQYRKKQNNKLLRESAQSPDDPSFQLSFHEKDSATIVEYMQENSVLDPQLDDEGGLNNSESLSPSHDHSAILKEKRKIALNRYSSHSTHSKMLFEFSNLKHKVKHEIKEVVDKSWTGRMFLIISYPLKILQDLTIFASHEGDWNKTFAIIQPFTVSAFLIWQFDFVDPIFTDNIALGLWIFTCLICSIIVWRFTLTKQAPEGGAGFFLMVISFAASCTWLNLLANVLVDYISLLSVWTGLPLNYIGLTLLAWGNSIPDFFVDTTLAKKGLGQAALSGVFAGQYFNLALGFGLALLRQVLMNGGVIDFNLADFTQSNVVNLMLIGGVMIVLLITMIYGYKENYVLKKGLAYFLLVVYGVFFIGVTVLSCFTIFDDN